MTRLRRVALAVAGGLLVAAGAGWFAGARRGAHLGEETFPHRPALDDAGASTISGPSRSGPLRVGFWGDAQRGIADVARPVARAARSEGLVALVQHGDLVSHGEAPYYGIVARALRRAGLHVPLLVVPGNHDVEPDGVRDAAAGRRLFEERMGPRWWSVLLSLGAPTRTLRVVGLDDGVGPPSEEQVEFLRAALARTPEDVAWILAIHRPPRALDRPGAPAAPGFEPLLRVLEARPPLAVVSGHLHGDHDVTVQGVRYLVNANGGDLDGGLFRKARPANLLVAELSNDGTKAFRRVPLDRDADLSVRLDQLCVRLWVERRRLPWAPWAVGGVGLALVVLALRGRRAAA